MTLEKLQVIIEAYTKPYRDELEKVKKETSTATAHVERQTAKISSSFKKIKGAVVGALSLAAILAFGKSCIQLGSDLTEVQNVVDVTFGSMSKQVDAFAKNAITKFGLSELTAKKYMGTYGAMAKSFGIVGEAGYQMSATITGLTGDVASFYNLSTDEAYTKLKSIFTGETESLKELGVVMTQTALDQYAINNGFGKTTAKMTEQEKVMLRYQFVMSTLADSSGDFARTSGTWANQVRILTLQFQSFKATIGQGLINVFTPVIQVINAVLAKLQTLANYFKAFTTALFGDRGGSDSGMAGSMASAAGSSGAIADNMGNAAGAAKKLKEYTMGIDELNVLNPDDGDSGGSGGSGGGGGVPDFGNMTGELFSDVTVNPAVGEAVQKLKGIIDELKEAAGPSREALQRLWNEGLAKLGNFVWTGLKDFWDYFLFPLTKWAMGTGFPMFVDAINNFLVKINWGAINEALRNFWKALEPFAEKVGEGLLKFFDDLLDVGATFINKTVPGGLNGIADAINKIDPEQAEAIGYGIGVIATSVAAFRISSTILTFFEKLTKLVTVAGSASFGITLTLALAGGTAMAWIKALDLADKYENGDHRERAAIRSEWNKNKDDTVSKNKWGMGSRYAQQEASTDAYMNDNAYTKQFEYLKTKARELWKTLFSPGEETINESAKNTMSRFGQQASATEWWTESFGKLRKWCSEKWDGVEIWYNTSVAPWFTADKWGGLYDTIKTSLKKKWDETAGQWIADIQTWWDTNVAPWFTVEKWSAIYESVKTSLKTKWDEAAGQWSTDISTWWEQNVSPWFTADKWSRLYENVKERLKETWDNTAGTWKKDIKAWWDNNVSPWFTIKKWSDLYETLKSQLKKKWDETWNNWKTDISTWWTDDVSPWFTVKKWSELYQTIKKQMKDTWDTTVEAWKTDISEWWDNHVSPWFTLDKWKTMMEKVPEAFKTIFKGAVNAAREQLNRFIDWVNKNLNFSFEGLEIKGKEIIPAFEFQIFTIPHIPAFASGGFPEDGLFMANHNELVGSFKGRTAVANNDQITTGIKQAVVEGMIEVMSMYAGNEENMVIETHVDMDGRTIVKQSDKVARRSGFNFRNPGPAKA